MEDASDGKSKWICELTLERLERSVVANALLENVEQLDAVLTALADSDVLNKFQIKRLKGSLEKNSSQCVEQLTEELFAVDDFSLSTMLGLLRDSNPTASGQLRQVLAEETTILEIEANVRKNCHFSRRGRGARAGKPRIADGQHPAATGGSHQPPARRFADGDKRLIAGLIRELTAVVSGSLSFRWRAWHEELLGVRHRKCLLKRDLSGMRTKLENRLLLTGFGDRLKTSSDDNDRSDDRRGFYESPESVVEAARKFARTLETFVEVFGLLKGRNVRCALLGNNGENV